MEKGLTNSKLKIIAFLLMVIDHIGVVIIGNCLLNYGYSTPLFGFITNPSYDTFVLSFIYTVLRLIGRLSFPLFAFLLVEGFFNTTNRKKYLYRLSIFALISEIPYDLMTSNMIFNIYNQNIFFILVLGIIMMILLEKEEDKLLKPVVVLLISLIASALQISYGIFGILLIFIFYFFRKKKDRKKRNIISGIFMLYQYTAPLSLLLINKYNGKRGKYNKYFFYIAYPIHMIILFLIYNLFVI